MWKLRLRAQGSNESRIKFTWLVNRWTKAWTEGFVTVSLIPRIAWDQNTGAVSLRNEPWYDSFYTKHKDSAAMYQRPSWNNTKGKREELQIKMYSMIIIFINMCSNWRQSRRKIVGLAFEGERKWLGALFLLYSLKCCYSNVLTASLKKQRQWKSLSWPLTWA